MSVVVRMEMPQKCFNCDLRYECNAFYAPGKPKPFMKGCMIVCQLPEGHGRLVDADALNKTMQERKATGKRVGKAVDIVKASLFLYAPTIVPAERSEE